MNKSEVFWPEKGVSAERARHYYHKFALPQTRKRKPCRFCKELEGK